LSITTGSDDDVSEAPADERNAECPEVPWCNEPAGDLRPVRRFRLAANHQERIREPDIERVIGRQRCRLDSRQPADALDQPSGEAVVGGEMRRRVFAPRVLHRRRLELCLEDAGHVEAWIGSGQVPEAPNQQAGARDEHNGERHFNDDESRSHGASVTAAGCAAAARGRERRLHVGVPGLEHGQRPERDAYQRGYAERHQ
jgi:hypothetical protein